MLFAISRERGEGVFNAKSGVNHREAFGWPTSSKAAYVIEARTRMAFRGKGGNL